MPTFNAWDVIKVPFPYTDRPVRERRPALVVSSGGIQEAHGLVRKLMITSEVIDPYRIVYVTGAFQ